MSALIAASEIRTCLGGGADTMAALIRGECGAGPLRYGDPRRLGVSTGYAVPDTGDAVFRASRMLGGCVAAAVRRSGVDPATERVVALVGTGLRELSAVEEYALTGAAFPAERLHFGAAVRDAVPGLADVTTLSIACSAGGHALALAQDMVDAGEADAVVVCAVDTATRSMLAMIGKVAPEPADRVRPFDRDRAGVLLGDGVAALVVVPGSRPGPALGRLLGTGLSCDAHHPTAPDVAGIGRAMRDAFERAGRTPAAVDLVVAHGTGTALNDPVECTALCDVVRTAGGNPLVTAVKGAVGHTSGAAALINVDVALRAMSGGVVPPVVGLRTVLDEGRPLRFVIGRAEPHRPRLAQVNAFGFGGVNAVTLMEPA